jgi:hypothetical protein
MFLVSNTTQRFSRALAVLTLLFVCGTQVIEAGHGHTAEDLSVDCLLCSDVTGAVILGVSSLTQSKTVSDQQIVANVLRTKSSVAFSRAPRGPPHIS